MSSKKKTDALIQEKVGKYEKLSKFQLVMRKREGINTHTYIFEFVLSIIQTIHIHIMNE